MNARVLAASALAVLTVGLLAATPGHGARYELGALDQSIRLTNHVWRTPCAGEVTIRFGAMPYRYVGYAQFAEHGPGRPYTDCLVVLATHEDWSDPVWLCSVLLHEYGHLAGMGHSANPRSIMFPIVQADRRCKRLFRGGR